MLGEAFVTVYTEVKEIEYDRVHEGHLALGARAPAAARVRRVGSASHPASYYAASSPGVEYPPLQGDTEADVCIVGAGYTGLSSGLHLAKAGLKVVVLEAARVGFGASGRNGGQIVHSYSRDLDVIERRYGAEQARALGAMAFEGAEVLRGFVAEHRIDCDLKPGGVFAALTARQAEGLREQRRCGSATATASSRCSTPRPRAPSSARAATGPRCST